MNAKAFFRKENKDLKEAQPSNKFQVLKFTHGTITHNKFNSGIATIVLYGVCAYPREKHQNGRMILMVLSPEDIVPW